MGSLGEAGISFKYDVDDVLRLLEPVGVFLVVFVILVLLFLGASGGADWKDLCRIMHYHIEWLLLG